MTAATSTTTPNPTAAPAPAAERHESVLVVDGLRKSYGQRVAVDDIGFHVPRGEVLGLLGPNGAGKSTTLGMVCGLVPPEAGAVEIEGCSLASQRRHALRRLGFAPQDLALYPDLTVTENVRFFGRLYGLKGARLRERTQVALAAGRLEDRAKDLVRTLSGGMKRRLNVAVALVHEPSALVLDEPTVGVDPQSRLAILEEIRRVADGGVGVVFASHHMHEVQTLCDRVAVVDHGRILVCDRIPALLGGLSSHAEVVFAGTANDLPESPGVVVDTATSGDRTTVRLESRDDQQLVTGLTDLLDGLGRRGRAVLEIRKHEPNLEQLFFELTGRSLRD